MKGQKEELLQRTVKRDHRIDALAKKLDAASKEKETEAASRAKAEEEVLRSEERVRVLRKRRGPPHMAQNVLQRSCQPSVHELHATRLMMF